MNLRNYEVTDLQSVAFDHLATLPIHILIHKCELYIEADAKYLESKGESKYEEI